MSLQNSPRRERRGASAAASDVMQQQQRWLEREVVKNDPRLSTHLAPAVKVQQVWLDLALDAAEDDSSTSSDDGADEQSSSPRGSKVESPRGGPLPSCRRSSCSV